MVGEASSLIQSAPVRGSRAIPSASPSEPGVNSAPSVCSRTAPVEGLIANETG